MKSSGIPVMGMTPYRHADFDQEMEDDDGSQPAPI
jgi:hypothetical protein